MKWDAKIVKVGEEVMDLFKDTEQMDIKLEGITSDLDDYSVLFDNIPENTIKLGETIKLGYDTYSIVGIGELVNDRLMHGDSCTLDFSGRKTASSPAAIMLRGYGDPATNVCAGNSIHVR